METESEQQLFLKIIRNLLDGETVLLRHTFSEYNWLDVVLDLLIVELLHPMKVHFGCWVGYLGGTRGQTHSAVINLKYLISPSYIDKRSAVDLSSFFLGETDLNKADLFTFLLALRDVNQDGHSLLVLDGLPQDHAGHEMPQDIGISGGIMLFNFPETVVERQILVLPFL